MKTSPPVIFLETGRDVCASIVDWDQESFVLSLSVCCDKGNGLGRDERLSDVLNAQFGIGQDEYRLLLGEMDVLLDCNRRISSFEMRTNPSGWRHCSLSPVSDDLPLMSVGFLAEFDENRISSHDLTVQIVIDPSRRELVFCFGGFVTHRRVLVANDFVVGMTFDNYLSEFRLLNFVHAGRM